MTSSYKGRIVVRIEGIMVIRDFQEQDREMYYQMADEFYHTEACLHPSDLEHYKRNFDGAMDRDNPYFRGLLITVDNRPVGYCLISHSWSSEVAGRINIVEELYFRASERGKGFGSKVFEWLFDDYNNKVGAFRLEVAPDNARVMEMYKRHGFEPLGYLQMIRGME